MDEKAFFLDDVEDSAEQDGLHDESAEATIKAGLRRPYEPMEEERREHEITHIPYRSWCRHCVRGKAKRQFHSLSDQRGQDKAKNTTYMDYFYMGRREEECLPILMIADELTSRTMSFVHAGERCWERLLCDCSS